MGGQVVHAVAGDRAKYTPVRSILCRVSQPETVLAALLALHPFRTAYVANLDAIQGQGDNFHALAALRRLYPRLQFWVDAGFTDAVALERFLARGLGHPVLGTESLEDADLLSHPSLARAEDFPVLSLDFRGDSLMAAADLWNTPSLWPEHLIAMTLGRVGTGRGPDLARLRAIRRKAPHASLYAAGGIRDAADLQSLAKLGVQGALVATALHSGRLDAKALSRYASV